MRVVAREISSVLFSNYYFSFTREYCAQVNGVKLTGGQCLLTVSGWHVICPLVSDLWKFIKLPFMRIFLKFRTYRRAFVGWWETVAATFGFKFRMPTFIHLNSIRNTNFVICLFLIEKRAL